MTSKQPTEPANFHVPSELPPRLADAHKGSHGHLFVLGGSVGMSGAPRLVAGGADRVGVGLLRMGIPRAIRAEVAASLPEAMLVELAPTQRGQVAYAALGRVESSLKWASATVIGPGLGLSEDLLALTLRVLERAAHPVLVDADSLHPEILDVCRSRNHPTVLTPHPGEAARLLGVSVAEIQADRRGALARLCDRSRATVVLKGAGTLVMDQGLVYENRTGNPGLARGGSGDVLAGMIGGLLAQGVSIKVAAGWGVLLHGRASDRAREAVGERAQTVHELLGALASVVLDMEVAGRGGLTFPSPAPPV